MTLALRSRSVETPSCQQNWEQLSAVFTNPSFGRFDGRLASPPSVATSIPQGLFSGITRIGAGNYTITTALPAPAGLWVGTVTTQGLPGVTVGTFAPLTSRTFSVGTWLAGVATDDVFTVVVGG